MKDKVLLWRKAAVLGSLWAASEIILGSFLHNARIPFSGRLLTGIGIAVMVAGHRLWPERGLLWRAALVCAAMKSVSPSAVLISPMVAIFTEGLLAELAVRLAGANIAGYMLAGGLAMSWGLIHKVGRLLILYGADAVYAYGRGLEKIMALLGASAGVWAPVLALLGLYFVGGMASSLLGLRAARPGPTVDCRPRDGSKYYAKFHGYGAAYYSVYSLLLHLLVLGGLMASGSLPLAAAVVASLAYGLACAFFYLRAAALLRRGWLWTGVVAISLLAGWLLSDLASGLRMAARAFALTLGFAAVAQELLNPAVRGALERAAGKTFFETLEYAFGALPQVLAALPSGRDMLLRPAASLRTLLLRAPELLAAAEKENKRS
ncbi:MAG: hypothetical protein A2X35_07565 [Elusimicrobia bacterium GWA2_61_42]|nr:MAG: hypothetical protein A2X35_07565 [Elusimicrobia bacterium GWA2_61_42]OGR77934.1 MAG: hypothetical protein A2X38_10595 [Elusimicrobia bacterium GWC2_61_25]